MQIAVHLDVPRDELVRRLLTCGRGADDAREIIERRLEVFAERTLPMLDYYAQRETVVAVEGSHPVDADRAHARRVVRPALKPRPNVEEPLGGLLASRRCHWRVTHC